MTVFTELTIIIVGAAVMAAIMRLLKQPIIIGHILTGIIVGPLVLDIMQSGEIYSVLAQLGISFLLFIVGISLSPLVIREVGKVSLWTGLGQIVFTSLIGYAIARVMGFSTVVSLYIGVALTFSSTIIILKLLSDKRALEKLYGKISIGFLIVQDIVAVLILGAISAYGGDGGLGTGFIWTLVRGGALIALLFFVSRTFLPKLSSFFARQQELLFFFSIAWGLGMASVFHALGFSIEIGALASGVALAASPYSVEVVARLKPLRDFFIVLFFILLGGQMMLSNIGAMAVPIAVFSAFILIGNPLIVMVIMALLGYGRRTGFLAGLTVAQISEFSLIMIHIGNRFGHIENNMISLITAVGLITIAGSTYLIMYAEKIYPIVEPWLRPFEMLTFRRPRNDQEPRKEYYEALLFGLNRIGYDFLNVCTARDMKMLVVDFNPEVGEELVHRKIPYRYGDADDSEFLESLPLHDAKIIVSTIPEFSTNALLVRKIRAVNKKAIIMVLSHAIHETIALYQWGATYVVMPHFLGGKYAAHMIERYGINGKLYTHERDAHLAALRERQARGHEHPVHEKLR